MSFDDEEHHVKRVLENEVEAQKANSPVPSHKSPEREESNEATKASEQDLTSEKKEQNSSFIESSSSDTSLNNSSDSSDQAVNSMSEDSEKEISLTQSSNKEENSPSNSSDELSKESSAKSPSETVSEVSEVSKDSSSESSDENKSYSLTSSKEQYLHTYESGFDDHPSDNENPEAHSFAKNSFKDLAHAPDMNREAGMSNDSEKSSTDAENLPDNMPSQDIQTQEEKFVPPHLKNTAEDDNPMGLLDHLSELRRRLTRVVIIVLLGFFAFYGVSEQIYTFLSAPLTINLPEGSNLIYTSPQGAFFTYLKVSFMTSLIATTPYTFYQVWAFIAPGLYKEEQKALMPLAFLSAFFFLGGAAFCYYMVFPVAFKFFMGFTTDVIIPMISVEEYLSFAIKLVLAFGLVFEMPLFAFFLAKLRIITPDLMRKYRQYAILGNFIVAAILTPPDVFSQLLMAAPMCLLYEISIYVAKVARGPEKEEKKDEEKAETEQTA